uniref:Uncharacterized protein n=1 Tax=Ananas comosus var. bracteatus TaxID=296719 RepID=A0A6V7QH24_ANACO|nr:unnamed protein product [Ananas comosus var. bracteatus]
MVANPASQITVIANLVGARAAAQMGWRETAVCMFAVGMAHYLVLFVTLYQRFLGSNSLPAMLRPVFFLFFAHRAWPASPGTPYPPPSTPPARCSSSFLSSYLPPCGKIDRYSSIRTTFGLCVEAGPIQEIHETVQRGVVGILFPSHCPRPRCHRVCQEVKGEVANALMLVLSILSVVVTLALMVFTAIRTNDLLPQDDPFACFPTVRRQP